MRTEIENTQLFNSGVDFGIKTGKRQRTILIVTWGFIMVVIIVLIVIAIG